jgi:hypothetical protein
MKKILSIFLFVLLTVSLNAQVLRTNPFYVAPIPPAGYCDEYQAVLAEMTTDPLDAVKTAQNTLVEALVDGGYWARMDLFYVFATEVNTASEALINWINPGTFNADNVSATSWTTLEGYTGDGVADYISTNWIPNTDAINFTLDDATAGVYCRANIAAEDKSVIGNTGSGAGSTMLRPLTGTLTSARINSSGAIGKNNTYSYGLFAITRRADNDIELYRNGASLGTDIDASDGLSSTEMCVLRWSTEYSTNQVAVVFFMDGISDEEATAINTIIETYMDAFGKGVQ